MKNSIQFISLFLLFFATNKLIAQTAVSDVPGYTPQAKSVLDINSTTKGFLWPRMTLAQRNTISSSPGITPEGLTIFDTDTKNLWIYKNSAWKPYLASPWDVNGNNIFNTNTESVLIGTGAPIPGLPNKLLVVATSTDAIRAFSETGCTICATNSIGTAVAGNATSTGYGGYFTSTSGYALITGTGNVGIGTFGPSQKLDIDGQIRIRGGSPALGKVLTSAADGTAFWEATSLPTHNHFGEQWVGNTASNGLRVENSNNTNNSATGLRGSMIGGGTAQNTGVEGLTDSEYGTGVLGINLSSTSHGLPTLNSGVSGLSGTGSGVYGNSVSGPSIYGRKTTTTSIGNVGLFENNSQTNPDATVLISNAYSNPTALELKNGYLKVSGTNKTAFIITAGTGSTIFGNRVRFSYSGMSSTDILIVNHQFVTNYIGAVGNWYDTLTNQWSIFREDQVAMPAGEKFTVLVIKQ
jgi:hypothetical protein